jgi:hypothetical protein
MTSFNKTVTFEECITIRYYEYERSEEDEDKKGKDWQRTADLTCREFKLSVEKGGCGGNWNILESKLDELDEPYWFLIGQLWQRLYRGARRIEEEEEESSDEEEDGNEKPSADTADQDKDQ